MKIEEIKKRIEEIYYCSFDNEQAHCLEDELFYDFVYAINNKEYKSIDEIIEASNEVYKVRKINFERWHA